MPWGRMIDNMGDILVATIPAVISATVAVVTLIAGRKDTKDQLVAQKAEADEKQNEIILLTLRTNIMTIYAAYRSERQMPIDVYQGMCEMYDKYKEKGGNSFVHQIKVEMDSWIHY